MKENCDGCRFSRTRLLHQTHALECHRHTPRGVTMPGWAGSRDAGIWPEVATNDWCGEFERKDAPERPTADDGGTNGDENGN